jgi:hypothetical protein
MAEQEKFEYKHGFRLGAYLIGWAVIYYIVFGILSNYWQKTGILDDVTGFTPIGDHVLFVYQNFINFQTRSYYYVITDQVITKIGTWYILYIFLAVAIFVGYSEDFLIYAVKRNIWLIPHVIILSIIWDALNDVAIYRPFVRTATWAYCIFMNIGQYFSSPEGYINLAILFAVFVGGGLLGGWIKIFRRQRLYKKAQLMIEKEVESS